MSRGSTSGGVATADALRLEAVTRIYESSRTPVIALNEVSLALAPGTFTAIMGPSGSGKSTLLHCASGLDQPTRGKVYIGGAELPYGRESKVTKFRRGRIGFIFQQYNLMPTLTVRQNVLLPARLSGKAVDQERYTTVLERIGLADRLDHQPSELSGGEQQRVAIARALVTAPEIVFADEPTGALDTATAREILTLLDEAVYAFGQTVVMVTHDPVAAAQADLVLFLADGRIVGEMPTPTAAAVAERMTRLGDDVVERETMAEA
ncbi:ABC transporter ATP-binding protein [Phytohabitans kaempferiae]|uniref:ABC transporter ATP-binding protein n=1 Tax=Phytohabitans kaempferiae TaxID=1620943 RepID=A0ABV6MF72_9ACTN